MSQKVYARIYSLKEMDVFLKNPEDSLIVFDVDYTLTHPNEPAFQFANFAKNKEIIHSVFKDLNTKERDLFANLMVFHVTGNSLIENDGAQIIEGIQKKGYKTLALTASLTKPIHNECLVKKRIQNLKDLGIDFSESFQEFKNTSFNCMASNFKAYPCFLDGVLFTNGENQKNHKGDLLVQFLKSILWKPKHVIFVDDRIQNLQLVHESLANFKKNLDFVGLHFLGALKYPSQEVSKESFRQQIESLAQEAKKTVQKLEDE